MLPHNRHSRQESRAGACETPIIVRPDGVGERVRYKDCALFAPRLARASFPVSCAPTSNWNQPLRLPHRASSIVLKEVHEGAILFSTETEVYYSLNQIGLRVWRLLPPECSQVDEVVEKIHVHFPDVSAETIAADVRSLVDELRANGLVESEPT